MGVGVCIRPLARASLGACAEALAVLPGRGRVHAPSFMGKLRGVRGGACSSACAGRACGSHPLARTPRGIATCFSSGVRCGEGMFSSKSGFLINVIEEMVLSIYGKKGSFVCSFEEKSVSLHVSEFVFIGIIIVITITRIRRFRFDVYLPATKFHAS